MEANRANNRLEKAILDCLSSICQRINEDVWVAFAQTPADELYIYHFGLGLYLRNNALMSDGELYRLFTLAGIWHKDDMSSIMMKRWHKALNGWRETASTEHEQIQDYIWRVPNMEETGIIRKIDELGRIVLPIEIRKVFDLKERDLVEILTDKSGIYLKPYDTKHCAFCADKDNLISHDDKYICETCLTKINEQRESVL